MRGPTVLFLCIRGWGLRMRWREVVLFAALTAGCESSLFDQTGGPKFTDEDVVDDTDAPDTDVGTDVDPDTDVDTDVDTDTDTDTDAGPQGGLCHPYDPVDISGWERTYRVVYNGGTGQEIQKGKGAIQVGGVGTVYKVNTVLDAGDDKWDGDLFYRCDVTDDGAYYVRSEKTVQTKNVLIIIPITQTQLVVEEIENPPRYLPGANAVGGIGSWNNAYTTTLSMPQQGGQDVKYDSEELYVEFGSASITVDAGTFDNAYYVTNTYVQTPEESGGILSFFGFTDIFAQLLGLPTNDKVEAWSEYYYVEGLGLVYQITTDVNTQDVLMERELVSFSGLQPIP